VYRFIEYRTKTNYTIIGFIFNIIGVSIGCSITHDSAFCMDNPTGDDERLSVRSVQWGGDKAPDISRLLAIFPDLRSIQCTKCFNTLGYFNRRSVREYGCQCIIQPTSTTTTTTTTTMTTTTTTKPAVRVKPQVKQHVIRQRY
jgi:hypothetical protein